MSAEIKYHTYELGVHGTVLLTSVKRLYRGLYRYTTQ